MPVSGYAENSGNASIVVSCKWWEKRKELSKSKKHFLQNSEKFLKKYLRGDLPEIFVEQIILDAPVYKLVLTGKDIYLEA